MDVYFLKPGVKRWCKPVSIILTCAALLTFSGCASRSQNVNEGHYNNQTQDTQTQDPQAQGTSAQKPQPNKGFEQPALVTAVSTYMGVTSESVASTIERLVSEYGKPVAYITGQESGGAFTVGVRYGKGTLWMDDGTQQDIYWQGPTIGFDVGADASKIFTLVYGLDAAEDIFRRFPGVEGSAYLIAGMAINYQHADDITLALIRTGVGGRLGANMGYTRYTRKRSLIPL